MSYKGRQSFGLKVQMKTKAGTKPGKASLSIGASDAEVALEAVRAGAGGNLITVAFVDPGSDADLSVVVTEKAIVVNLEVVSSSIVSTANDVITALLESPAARSLVTPSAGSGDGTDVVAAAAAAPLTSGSDGTEVFQEIPGLGDVSIPGLGRTAEDLTSHSSEGGFAEYLKSAVKDGREITIPFNFDPSNEMHQLLKLEEESDEPTDLRFIYKFSGASFQNSGLVLDVPTENPVRGKLGGNVKIQLTGAPLALDLA